jgi:protein xylosyltransferase
MNIQRQDYLFRELMRLEPQFENIRLTRNRYATIWGGASLLTVLMNGMQDLLTMDGWSSEWDYIINLSESDFPIK